MQTIRETIAKVWTADIEDDLQLHITLNPSILSVSSAMEAWAQPAIDALRKIRDFYIPTIQRMEESSYTGSASEALSKIISEALKQYNQ